MSFIKEFKTFAMRGNVVDMAVGIIIGGAFGKIVSSLVSDIIMPPVRKANRNRQHQLRKFHQYRPGFSHYSLFYILICETDQ